MKKLLSLMMVVTFFAVASVALACPPENPTCDSGVAKTWNAIYDPADVTFDSSHYYDLQYPYAFDLNIVTAGFQPTIDLVKSYSLDFYFTDKDCLKGEKGKIVVDDVSYDTAASWYGNILSDTDIDIGTIAGSASLNADGILSIKIYRTKGDFAFASADLVANGWRIQGTYFKISIDMF